MYCCLSIGEGRIIIYTCYVSHCYTSPLLSKTSLNFLLVASVLGSVWIVLTCSSTTFLSTMYCLLFVCTTSTSFRTYQILRHVQIVWAISCEARHCPSYVFGMESRPFLSFSFGSLAYQYFWIPPPFLTLAACEELVPSSLSPVPVVLFPLVYIGDLSRCFPGSKIVLLSANLIGLVIVGFVRTSL